MCRRSRVNSHSATGRPSTRTRPALAVIRQLIILSEVVLPEPLGPSSIRISPCWTVRLKSERRTRFCGVRYCTWTNSIAGESLTATVRAIDHRPSVDGVSPSFGCTQPSRQKPGWRLPGGRCRAGRVAPPLEVVSVDGETEDVGGNEPPLSRVQPDDRDDNAVDSGHDPSLPHSPPHQHGR